MFENYIKNARTDEYKIMCSIDAHEKNQPLIANDGSSGGGNTLPSNATTDMLGEFYKRKFY